MSVDLSSGNNYSLGAAAGLELTSAISIAAWINPDTSSATDNILGCYKNSGGFEGYALRYVEAGPNISFWDGTSERAGPTITTGLWQHVMVAADGTTGTMWVDSSNNSITFASMTGSGVDKWIGALDPSSTTEPMDGKLSDLAVWDVKLTTAEHDMLAVGISPLMVRPGSLIAYWPLIRGGTNGAIDVVGGINGTQNGTVGTVADPLLIKPSGQAILFPLAAAPPGPAVGDIRLDIETVSAQVADIGSAVGAVQTDVAQNISFAYALNDAHMYVNGVAGTPDTSMALPVGISTFNVGSDNAEANQFNGHIRELRYYNIRKTDAFLKDLSLERITVKSAVAKLSSHDKPWISGAVSGLIDE